MGEFLVLLEGPKMGRQKKDMKKKQVKKVIRYNMVGARDSIEDVYCLCKTRNAALKEILFFKENGLRRARLVKVTFSVVKEIKL